MNLVVWRKSDPPYTLSERRLNFSAEYIIWASKQNSKKYYFNYELLKSINSGVPIPDVWTLPAADFWEKRCGKHPTPKPYDSSIALYLHPRNKKIQFGIRLQVVVPLALPLIF